MAQPFAVFQIPPSASRFQLPAQVLHVAPLQPPSLAGPSAGAVLPSVPALPMGHMVPAGLLSSTPAPPPALPLAPGGLGGAVRPPADLSPPLLFQVYSPHVASCMQSSSHSCLQPVKPASEDICLSPSLLFQAQAPCVAGCMEPLLHLRVQIAVCGPTASQLPRHASARYALHRFLVMSCSQA